MEDFLIFPIDVLFLRNNLRATNLIRNSLITSQIDQGVSTRFLTQNFVKTLFNLF